nr:RNA-dependent RNA polymerase [Watermelon crinkle leaf-associated virus 1]
MSLRVDSNFSVGSLTLKKIEPTLFLSTDIPEPIYSCKFLGDRFKIVVNGRDRELDVSSEFLRKIRHEIVSDVMLFQSDAKLSKIGVIGDESELSPDFINRENRTVLELGTTAISELFSLKNAYSGKSVKYSYLVEPLGYDLFILIVSPSRVYSNFHLTQDVVNCLCYRMRIGLALEAVISEELGQDIFSEDLSADEAIVKDVFRGLTTSYSSMFDFDLDKILSCTEPLMEREIRDVGVILRKSLQEATKKSTESETTLQEYLDKFMSNTKKSNKRITNIPMIYQHCLKDTDEVLDPHLAKDMPLYLKKIWGNAENVTPVTLSRDDQIAEALGDKHYERHRIQKGAAFNVKNLTKDDKIEAAKTGLWAKSMESEQAIKDKEVEDKKSFHPTLTDTHDIKEFSKRNLLYLLPQSIIPKEILRLLRVGKSVWNSKKESISLEIFELLSRTVVANFGQTVSNIMSEICYSHKYWIKRSDFYHKKIFGIHLLIRCTGDHVFVAFAFPKSTCKKIDTGRLGPSIWESSRYLFTDVCSFNEPTIEHFVKAGPYLISILCHLTSHLEMDLRAFDINNSVLSQHMNHLLLVYLCNKLDCEELITSQRYLTMGILEDVDPNPYRFCERLPEVIRSRLTCYFIKKTISHINYYATTKIMKVPNKENLEYDVNYIGLKSLFADYEPTIKQKINEFYFGYVVSKEKGRGNDRNFKIMKKIVQEEYRFRDTVTSTLENTYDLPIHVSNHVTIKVFCSIFKTILASYLGKDYQSVIKREIYRTMAQASFEDLATLKVSSRSYKDNIIVPNISSDMENKEIRRLYELSNPDEKKRRPRVMEAISKLVEECETALNKPVRHPVELLPYCLSLINQKGYWDSDIFPKAQHGGDREIHVLDITMRIIQYFAECISRTLCRMVPSDTLTHPYEKESFVRKHYTQSAKELGANFFTMGKSADATKWCQRNDSSKFASVVVPFLPPELRPFFLQVMYLWKFKRISFPIQFAANFVSNRTTKSNKTYERMRDEFFTGTGIFSQQQSNKIMIRSGMMQGILHYTSSFTHSVVQEVMKKMQRDYLKRRGVESYITVVQGSDDSAELISLPGLPTKNKVRIVTTMLNWKETISRQFSIYTSRAKSSIGTLDLIEYNSEWMIRSNIVKPTFRWVSACLETSVTERFIDRIRMNYNISSQVLEGGGKVLEVAMVQLCQAWMHYLLLGLHTSQLADIVANELTSQKDPSLGFYPLDSDYCAGITGVEFQLFRLFQATEFGRGLSYANIHDNDTKFEEEEVPDHSINKTMRSVKIKFSNMKLWKDQLRRMDVPELEELIEAVEENPYLIYTKHKNWNEAKYSIFLKMFQPGVKESLSAYSATARVMSASAYLISRPCISFFTDGDFIKCSLLKALLFNRITIEDKDKLDVSQVFTHSEEYQEIMEYIIDLENHSVMMEASLRTKTKQKITVFEKHVDEVPLIELCRKKWFGLGKIPLSRRQFDTFWNEAKLRYPFLKDSRKETKEILRMNEVELKGFLESVTSKPRHIVLLDTSARSSSLFNSLTRIFWSNTKLILPGRSDDEETSYSLRSKLFSILSSWYSGEIKKEWIMSIILNCSMFDKPRVPSRIKKLKVFYRWFKGQSKHSIIRYISEECLGTVGFFTLRQTGWGENRRGLGEWRGKCMDISVIVRMNGNTCESVTVNKLVNLRVLGPQLLDLVNGFSLKQPTNTIDCDHWLSSSGRILGGAGKSTYIPIIIDPAMKVDIIDKISDYNWSWNIDHNRLRLQAEYGVNHKITILSEQFNSLDWDPQFVVDDDKLLGNWSSGIPMSMDLIESEIESICKPLPGHIMKAFNNRHKIKSKSGWLLSEFISVVNKQLLNDCEIEELEKDEEEAFDLSDIDFDAVLDEMNVNMAGSLDWSFSDKFEDDNDFDPDLFQENLELSDQVLNQLALFSINPIVEELNPEDKTTMPKTNLALSRLNDYCCITWNDKNFFETVKRFKADSTLECGGFFGTLLSFFCGRICLRVPDEYDTYFKDFEEDSIAMSSHVISHKEGEDIDIKDLNETISFLESTKKNAPGRARARIEQILLRYENIKTQKKLEQCRQTDMEDIKVCQILGKLKQFLIDSGELPNSYRTIRESIFYEILKNELDTIIDEKAKSGELTWYQQSTYREAIRKPYLTSLFLDALSFRYDLKIKLAGYETCGTVEYVML